MLKAIVEHLSRIASACSVKSTCYYLYVGHDVLGKLGLPIKIQSNKTV